MKSRRLVFDTRAAAWKVASQMRGMREFAIDWMRYRTYSSPTRVFDRSELGSDQLECQVTKEYHRIEKGLSLPAPRRPFGAEPKERLEALLPAHRGSVNGPDFSDNHSAEYEGLARQALVALEDWNESGIINDAISPLLSSITDFSGLDPELAAELFTSRRSIRDFSDRPVAREKIADFVEIASNTPSVCNRQPWRVRIYSGQRVQEILALHNGSAAFAMTIPHLAIVTVRTGLFSGSGERNQRWIDGGLFAMSLVWAAHSLGLGTCMLNWSRSNADTAKLRRVTSIREDEDVIVLIGFGYSAEETRVARSERRGSKQILIFED
ncbi:nitroreductase family protein [Gordonia alkanivorans]|uniref:nitroreductase family protein n=1 Tax=Gordonia alkanivorans TaxID=84096 RepID=UPI0024475791|nr:nitroreductase family protein [Gordonia alkanivorans]MDH3022468.1 nitroreductase family protein [Gordonia alkanivorans]